MSRTDRWIRTSLRALAMLVVALMIGVVGFIVILARKAREAREGAYETPFAFAQSPPQSRTQVP